VYRQPEEPSDVDVRAAWVAQACGLLAMSLGSDTSASVRQAKVI